MKPVDLKYIVTGTGRCGTVYAARLLTSVEIPCSHEGIFGPAGLTKARRIILEGNVTTSHASTNGEKSYLEEQPVADSSYMAAPHIDKFNAKVIHVVRNPMRVLESFYHHVGFFAEGYNPADVQTEYRNFVYVHLPSLRRISDEVSKTAAYIVLWNRMIEEKCEKLNSFFHCVESCLDDLWKFLEIPSPSDYFISKRTNSWTKTKYSVRRNLEHLVTFEDIQDKRIQEEFRQLCIDYGYDLRV